MNKIKLLTRFLIFFADNQD